MLSNSHQQYVDVNNPINIDKFTINRTYQNILGRCSMPRYATCSNIQYLFLNAICKGQINLLLSFYEAFDYYFLRLFKCNRLIIHIQEIVFRFSLLRFFLWKYFFWRVEVFDWYITNLVSFRVDWDFSYFGNYFNWLNVFSI